MIYQNSNVASGEKLLKVGEVASMLSINPRRTQYLLDTSLSHAVRFTSGGHRMVLESAVLEFMGVQAEPAPSAPTAHAVAIHRVSSDGQKESLKSQQRITSGWIKSNLGNIPVTEYTSVRSSVNFAGKTGFTQMLQDFIEGKHTGCKVVVTTPCRLGRIGTQLIQFLIEQVGGAELVFVDPSYEDAEDDLQDDIRSICDFLVHINAKRVGARTAARIKRVLSPEQLKKCWFMRCQSYSIAEIEKEMRGEMTPNGKVTARVIESQLMEHEAACEAQWPRKSIKSHFQQWVETALIPSSTSHIRTQDVISKYVKYCRRNKVKCRYNGNKYVLMLRELSFAVGRKGTEGRSHVGAKWA